MVGWGAWALLQALDLPLPQPPLPSFVRRLATSAYAALRERPPVARAMLLGLFSTLLPCGWLYAFAVLAAGTGGPWTGMLVMAAFWSGTLPVMLGLGIALQSLAAPIRRRVPAIAALVLIAVGMFWLVDRVTMPTHGSHAGPAAEAGGGTGHVH